METFGGDRWGELVFASHGRHFYVLVGVGRHATRAQVRTLLRALDSLRVAASER